MVFVLITEKPKLKVTEPEEKIVSIALFIFVL
jgi:hypothetical protein